MATSNITLNAKATGTAKAAKDLNSVGAALRKLGLNSQTAAEGSENLNRSTTRLGQTSASTGRQFSAQAQGLGGLVGAYAGAAATIFALQQAFSALNRAAQVENIVKGTQTLAAQVGESGDSIIKKIQEITQSQLTLGEAAEKANLALATGFSTKQIEDLTLVATKASRALGRNLGEAFERLVRGSAKLEPELLDELGIFTRLDPAVEAYAKQLGKAAKDLTQFERRQAFVNAVIDEGSRKFSSIDTTAPSAQKSLERLSTVLSDLGTQFGILLANYLTPVADFFTNDISASLSIFAIVARQISQVAFRELEGAADAATKRLNAFGNSFLNNSVKTEKAAEALDVLNKELAGLERTYYRGDKAARDVASSFTALGKAGKLQAADLDKYIAAQTNQLNIAKQSELAAVSQRNALLAQGIAADSTDKRMLKLNATIAQAARDQVVLSTRVELANKALQAQSSAALLANRAIGALAKGVGLFTAAVSRAFSIFNWILLIASIAPIVLAAARQIEVLDNLINKITSSFAKSRKEAEALNIGIRTLGKDAKIDEISQKFVDLGLSAETAAKTQADVFKFLEDATRRTPNAPLVEFIGSAQGARDAANYLRIGAVALGVVFGGPFSAAVIAGAAAVDLLISTFSEGSSAAESFLNTILGFFGLGNQTLEESFLFNVDEKIRSLNSELQNAKTLEEYYKISQFIESLEAAKAQALNVNVGLRTFAGQLAQQTGQDASVILDNLSASADGTTVSFNNVTIAARNALGEINTLGGTIGQALVNSFIGFSSVLDKTSDAMNNSSIGAEAFVAEAQSLSTAQTNLQNALDDTNRKLSLQRTEFDEQLLSVKNLANAIENYDSYQAQGGTESLSTLEAQFAVGINILSQLQEQISQTSAIAINVERQVTASQSLTNSLTANAAQLEKQVALNDTINKQFASQAEYFEKLEIAGSISKVNNELVVTNDSFAQAANQINSLNKNMEILVATTQALTTLPGNLNFDPQKETIAEFVARAKEAIPPTTTLQNNIKLAVDAEGQLARRASQVVAIFIQQLGAIKQLVQQLDSFISTTNVSLLQREVSTQVSVLKAAEANRINSVKLSRTEADISNDIRQIVAETEAIRSQGGTASLENQMNILENQVSILNNETRIANLRIQGSQDQLEASKKSLEISNNTVQSSKNFSDNLKKAFASLKDLQDITLDIQIQEQELKKLELEISNLDQVQALDDKRFEMEKQLAAAQSSSNRAQLEAQKAQDRYNYEKRLEVLEEEKKQLTVEKQIADQNRRLADEQQKLQNKQRDLEVTALQNRAKNANLLTTAYSNFVDNTQKVNQDFLSSYRDINQELLSGLASVFSEAAGKTISAPTIAQIAAPVKIDDTQVAQLQRDLNSSLTDLADLQDSIAASNAKLADDTALIRKLEDERFTETEASLSRQTDLENERFKVLQTQRDAEAKAQGAASSATKEYWDSEEKNRELQQQAARLELDNKKRALQLEKDRLSFIQAQQAFQALIEVGQAIKNERVSKALSKVDRANEQLIASQEKLTDVAESLREAREVEYEQAKRSLELLKERRALEQDLFENISLGLEAVTGYNNFQSSYLNNIDAMYRSSEDVRDLSIDRAKQETRLAIAGLEVAEATQAQINANQELADAKDSIITKIGNLVEGLGKAGKAFTDFTSLLNGSFTGGGTLGNLVNSFKTISTTISNLGKAFTSGDFSTLLSGGGAGNAGNIVSSLLTGSGAGLGSFAAPSSPLGGNILGGLDLAGGAVIGAGAASLLGTAGGGLAGLAGSGGIAGAVGNFVAPISGILQQGSLTGIVSQAFSTAGAAGGFTSILGSLGAVLPAMGIIFGGIALLKKIFSRPKTKTSIATIDLQSKGISASGPAALSDSVGAISTINDSLETLFGVTSSATQLSRTVQTKGKSVRKDELTLYGANNQVIDRISTNAYGDAGKSAFKLLLSGFTSQIEDVNVKDAIARLNFSDEIEKNFEKLAFAVNFDSLLTSLKSGLADSINSYGSELDIVNAVASKTFESVKSSIEGLLSEFKLIVDETANVFGEGSRQVVAVQQVKLDALLAYAGLSRDANNLSISLIESSQKSLSNLEIIFATVEGELRAFESSITQALIDTGYSASAAADEAARIIEEGTRLRLRDVAQSFYDAIDAAEALARGVNVEIIKALEEVFNYQANLVKDAEVIYSKFPEFGDLIEKTERTVQLQRLRLIRESSDEQLAAIRTLTSATSEFADAFTKAAADAEASARKINTVFETELLLQGARRGSAGISFASLTPGFASGGMVYSPGAPSNKDSVPAMLMPGEYVINANSARKIGYDTLEALNSDSYKAMAGGGPVGNVQVSNIGQTVAIPAGDLQSAFAFYDANLNAILEFSEATNILTDANEELFFSYTELFRAVDSNFVPALEQAQSYLEEGSILMAKAVFDYATNVRDATSVTDAYNRIISEAQTQELLRTSGLLDSVDATGNLVSASNEFFLALQKPQDYLENQGIIYNELYRVTGELNKLLGQGVITTDEYNAALNSVNSSYSAAIQKIEEYSNFFTELNDSLDFTGAFSNVRQLVNSFTEATNTITYAVEDGFIDTQIAAEKQIAVNKLYNKQRIDLIKDSEEEQLKAIANASTIANGFYADVVDFTYQQAAALELLNRRLNAATESFGNFEAELVSFYNSTLNATKGFDQRIRQSVESVFVQAGVQFVEGMEEFYGAVAPFVIKSQEGVVSLSDLSSAIGQLNYQLTQSENIDIETYQAGISILQSSFLGFLNTFQDIRSELDGTTKELESFASNLYNSFDNLQDNITNLVEGMVRSYRDSFNSLKSLFDSAVSNQADAEESLYNTLFDAQRAFESAGGNLDGHVTKIKDIVAGLDPKYTGYEGLSIYLADLKTQIENGTAEIGSIDVSTPISELQANLESELANLDRLKALPDSADKFVKISRSLSLIEDLQDRINSTTADAGSRLANAALELVGVEQELNLNNLTDGLQNIDLTITDISTDLIARAQDLRAEFNSANEILAGYNDAIANNSLFINGLADTLPNVNDQISFFTDSLNSVTSEFNKVQEAIAMVEDAGLNELISNIINPLDAYTIDVQKISSVGGSLEDLNNVLVEYNNVLEAKNAYEALYGSISVTTSVLPIDEFNELNSTLTSLQNSLLNAARVMDPAISGLENLDEVFKTFVKDAISLLETPIQLNIQESANTSELATSNIAAVEGSAISYGLSGANDILNRILREGLGVASPGYLFYTNVYLEQIRTVLEEMLVVLGGVIPEYASTATTYTGVSPEAAAPGGATYFGPGLSNLSGLTGQVFSVTEPIAKPADYFYIVIPKLIDWEDLVIIEPRSTFFDEWLIKEILDTNFLEWFNIILADHKWTDWWRAPIAQDHNWALWWRSPTLQTHTWMLWWNMPELKEHDWQMWWEAPTKKEHEWKLWWLNPTRISHDWSLWWFSPILQSHDWTNWWNPADKQASNYFIWFNITKLNTDFNQWFNLIVKEIDTKDLYTLQAAIITYKDIFKVSMLATDFTTWFLEPTKKENDVSTWYNNPSKKAQDVSIWYEEITKKAMKTEDLFDLQIETIKVLDLITITPTELPGGTFFAVSQPTKKPAIEFIELDRSQRIKLTFEEIFELGTAQLSLLDIFSNATTSGFIWAKYSLRVEDVIDLDTGLTNKLQLSVSDIISSKINSVFSDWITISLEETSLSEWTTIVLENTTFSDWFNTEKLNINDLFTSTNAIPLNLDDIFEVSPERIVKNPSEIFALGSSKLTAEAASILEVVKSTVQATDFYEVIPGAVRAVDIIDFDYLSANKYVAQAKDVLDVAGKTDVDLNQRINITNVAGFTARELIDVTKSNLSGSQLFSVTKSSITGSNLFTITTSEVSGDSVFTIGSKVSINAAQLYDVTPAPLQVDAIFTTAIDQAVAELRVLNETAAGILSQLPNKIATSMNSVFFSYYMGTFLKTYYDQFNNKLNGIATIAANSISMLEEIKNVVTAINSLLPGINTTANNSAKLITIDSNVLLIKNNTDNLPAIKTNTDSIKSNTIIIKTNTDTIRTNTDTIKTNSGTVATNSGWLDNIEASVNAVQYATERLVDINKVRYVYSGYSTVNVPGFYTGGYVEGPGGATSDSIPAKLSSGEFVVKASAVSNIGKDFLDVLNSTGSLERAIASQGIKGDNQVAHINSAEASLLKMLGGSGTTNTATGLKQYFFDGRPNRASEAAVATMLNSRVNYGNVFSKTDAFPQWLYGNNVSSYSRGYNANNEIGYAVSALIRSASYAKGNGLTYQNKNWHRIGDYYWGARSDRPDNLSEFGYDWNDWNNSINAGSDLGNPSSLRGTYGPGDWATLANRVWNTWGVNTSNITPEGIALAREYGVPGYAGGGLVSGIGSNISDSITARLSDGEFVVRNSSVDKVGVDTLDYINRNGVLPQGDTNVEVNITNNGSPVETEGTPQVTVVDGKVVVDVVLKDLRTNGPIKKSISRMR